MYFVIVMGEFNQAAVHQFEDVEEAKESIKGYFEKGQAANLSQNIPVKVTVSVEIEV